MSTYYCYDCGATLVEAPKKIRLRRKETWYYCPVDACHNNGGITIIGV